MKATHYAEGLEATEYDIETGSELSRRIAALEGLYQGEQRKRKELEHRLEMLLALAGQWEAQRGVDNERLD